MDELVTPLLLLIAPFIMITAAVFLSISAFYGGFSFAHVRFLEKLKKLNDHICNLPASREHNDLLNELNEFLKSIAVEKNKATFLDWLKFGMTYSKEKRNG